MTTLVKDTGRKGNTMLLLFLAIGFIAIFLSRNNPFFWDTVQLASKHAHYFCETNFTSLILPPEIDSGHPPFFGMYIAWVWKIFGKSLPASHFAMLPFLWGIIFFLFEIGKTLTAKNPRHTGFGPLLLLLCFSDPVLASQSILVSPDLVLVCFFLMAVWSIWGNRSVAWQLLAIAGLGMVSMRGMMVVLGLFFWMLCQSERLTFEIVLKKMLPFVPGGMLALGFLVYHWIQTGWLGYHAGSAWAPSFQIVDFHGFLKNIVVLLWRFLDFGRVFVIVALVLCCFILWNRKIKPSKHGNIFKRQELNNFFTSTTGKLILLALLTFLTLVPAQVFYKGLLAHRYLLPIFISINFLLFHLLINELGRPFFSKIILFVLMLGFATGNCWVYPKGISMGWDSTLAHLPWYKLQKEMALQIGEMNLAMDGIGTAFPNIGPREMMDLNGINEGYVEKDLESQCFIMYSNVMNDFTNEEINELEENWSRIISLQKGRVELVLYKNPELLKCEN